jgi:hypothetical protein
MPFYLVIQTTLIEAEDENAAAEKAINQIRSGKKVAVTVKSDETTLTHIVVPAKADGQASAAMDEPDVGAERPTPVHPGCRAYERHEDHSEADDD